MEIEKQSNLTRFGTFAVLIPGALWLWEVGVVSPAMALIQQAFPGTPDALAQFATTAPYVTMFIVSFIAGAISKYMDKKIIMVIGLLLYGVTGMLPVLAANMTQILILRLITGIGAGLVIPMTSAIIADHVFGEKRTKMLAMTNVVSNIAAVVMALAIGFLMMITWKVSFYSFAICFIIAVIVIIGAPKSPPIKEETGALQEKVKIPPNFFLYFFGLGLVWMIHALFPIQISLMVFAENNFAALPPQIIGISMVTLSAGGIIASYFFPKIIKILKRAFIPVVMFVFAVGALLTYFAHSIPLLLVASVVWGLMVGFMTPYCFALIGAKSINQRQKDIGMGMVGASAPLGGVLCVPASQLIILFNHSSLGMNDYRWVFFSAVFIMLVVGIVTLFIRPKADDIMFRQ